MILNISHINKSFDGKDILSNATFFLNEHDRAAIVGANGAGKTTLLNIISGIDTADSGTVTISSGVRVGYLQQNNLLDGELTIRQELTKVIEPILALEDELLSIQESMKDADESSLAELYKKYELTNHAYEQLDGYAARSRLEGVLHGLGFASDADTLLSELSGGQKTRVFLGKLLLESPDILLLDEPTNHLDLKSIEWLEDYLRTYKGTLILVSHDRYFLDRIIDTTIEVENTVVTKFTGGYKIYEKKKEELQKVRLREYLANQALIKHQEAVIEKLRSFNREKSIKRADSRQKMLDKIERVEKPTELNTDMNLRFSQVIESGTDVLQVSGLSKAYDANLLFYDTSFEIKRGEHVAIIGDNGTGKTTLLKILTGLVPSDSGDVKFGARVYFAYYDQEHQNLETTNTVFEEISEAYPKLTNTQIRNTLASFLFTGDDVFKEVGDLSGGERGRLSLAKLMLSRANVLILDEPTNHLDIYSKEILERAICEYPGTVIYVSHDRYFIDKTATRILELSDRSFYDFGGNYSYYLEKRDTLHHTKYNIKTGTPSSAKSTASTAGVDGNNLPTATSSTANAEYDTIFAEGAQAPDSTKTKWQEDKQQKAMMRKLQRDLQKCEDDIKNYESQLADIEEMFLDPSIQSDAAQLLQLQKSKDELQQLLAPLYEKWEELMLQVDEQ